MKLIEHNNLNDNNEIIYSKKLLAVQENPAQNYKTWNIYPNDPKSFYPDLTNSATKTNQVPLSVALGIPHSGKSLNYLKQLMAEQMDKIIEEERRKEKELIENPNISATELFKIAKNSTFSDNVKKATEHPNFNMNQYMEEFCESSTREDIT